MISRPPTRHGRTVAGLPAVGSRPRVGAVPVRDQARRFSSFRVRPWYVPPLQWELRGGWHDEMELVRRWRRFAIHSIALAVVAITIAITGTVVSCGARASSSKIRVGEVRTHVLRWAHREGRRGNPPLLEGLPMQQLPVGQLSPGGSALARAC